MSFSSGKMVETSSSSLNWPRSTHCMAAIVVMNFVHDAIQKTESGVRGGAEDESLREEGPKAFW